MKENRNKLMIIIIIAAIILISLFVIIKENNENSNIEEENNNIDFSNITECNNYDGKNCEVSFENAKLGDKVVTIKYEIFKNENDEEVIKFYFDDFSPFENRTTSDLFLSDLAIIDDLFVIVLGKESISVNVMDESGAVALQYDYFIEDNPIREVKIENDFIIATVSKLDENKQYDYYDICSGDFYTSSGYSESDLGLIEYKTEYLGNKTFSDEEIISSKTIKELREENCN